MGKISEIEKKINANWNLYWQIAEKETSLRAIKPAAYK
jgi:hypothetical protein